MSWLGGGAFRLPSVPEPVLGSSSNVSTRLAGRQPQPYAQRPSPVAVGRGSQQPRLATSFAAANVTVLNTDPRLAAARLTSDIGIDQANGLFNIAHTTNDDTFQNVLPGLEISSIASPAPQQQHHQHSRGLPEELYKLTDPDASVNLPTRVVPGSLDNRELDKLVASLGRNKAIWRRALMLYEWLQESGHVMDDRLCTTLIRVCSEHGQAINALSIYEWMRSPPAAGGAGLSPTVFTYTAAMRAALAVGMHQKGLEIWGHAKAAGCQPDCRMCITYIEICSRMGLVERALSMYNEMKASGPSSRMAPTVHAYTAAMRAATEGGKWHKALEIWRDMRVAGCQPTGHAYAAVISACAAGNDWTRAVQLFEDMCTDGIKPDVVSCTALVTAMASAGQWQRAEAVIKWMIDYGLRPNVRTFTALLTALGNAKQWERSVEMLHLMQTPAWGSVQPNAYTYSALLKSLGEYGQWQLAELVFSQLEQEMMGRPAAAAAAPSGANSSSGGPSSSSSSSSSSSRPLVDLASMASSIPNWQSNLQLLAAPMMGGAGMAGSGSVSPAAMAAAASAAVAAAAAAVGHVGQREQQRSWTSPSQLNGLDLNLQHNSAGGNNFSLFSGSGFLKRPANAGPGSGNAAQDARSGLGSGAAAGSMQRAGSGSSGDSFSMVNDPIVALSSDMVATQFSQLSLAQQQQYLAQAEPAAEAAQPAGRSAHRAAQQPAKGLAKGSDRGLVNEVVCGALMLAYERAGKWEQAVGVLARARQLGLQPNTVMYNTAISAAGKAGQLEVAVSLFSELSEPDAVSFETMIAAYGMCGYVAKAEAMMRAMRGKGYRPRDYAYCGLIAAYSLSGDWQSALNIRARILKDNMQVTLHMYNALVAACERAGQYDKALELLREMKREMVAPNAVTHQLMVAIGKKGAASVETQQITAAAMSAALAAAGSLLIRAGAF